MIYNLYFYDLNKINNLLIIYKKRKLSIFF